MAKNIRFCSENWSRSRFDIVLLHFLRNRAYFFPEKWIYYQGLLKYYPENENTIRRR